MFSRLFKRFWRRNSSPAVAAKYPLSLARNQVEALREWAASPAHDAFQHVVTELAKARLSAVLTAEPQKVEFERGALASLTHIHDVVDVLLQTCEAVDDRTRSNGSKRSAVPDHRAQFWGNSLYWG